MTAVFITSTFEWAKGGPNWAIVGRLSRALNGLESLRKGERHVFICTSIRKWSAVSRRRVLTSRPSQISSSKNTLRGFGP